MSTYELIDGQFKLCQQYADDAFDLMSGTEGYLTKLLEAVSDELPELDTSWIEYDWPEPNIGLIPFSQRPAPPSEEDLIIDIGELPSVPTLDEISLSDIPSVPSLTAVLPALEDIEAPDATLPTDPGEAPVIEDPVLPTAPSYSLPVVPVLDELTIPAMPSITLPAFEGAMPTYEVSPFDADFAWSEIAYSSELLDQLKSRLLELSNGDSTGFPEEVATAIYNQALSRNASSNDQIFEEALNYWAARGFTLPPAMLAARLEDARIEIERRNSDINEKVLIEQTRLEQENWKSMLSMISQHEANMMTYAGQVAQRALEGAKALIQAGVEKYNAQVTYYNAQLDAYKTAAAVYQSRIQAALLELEAYKNQLEAVRIQGEVQMQQVELYKAQLAAVSAMIDIYKTEMQAASVKAETNRYRLEAFRTVVDVYSTKVQAKTAEYQMYQSRLAGQQQKVQVYSEQVRAFAAQVDAYRGQMEGIKTEADLKLSINKQSLDLYNTQLEGHRTALSEATAQVDAVLKTYGAQVQAYDTDIRGGSAQLDAEVKVFDSKMQQAKNQTDLMIQASRANIEAFVQNKTLEVEAAKSGANVCAQLVASALSAIHASASGGYSYSYNSDETKAVPSQSTVYEYIYNE